MKKKEYFAEQGIVTTHAAYIEKGMFRYVCTDENGCEHILQENMSVITHNA